MRVLFAVVLLGLGSAARAADLPLGDSGLVFEPPQHAAMVWLADDQPGVIVRRYWSPPWHYHHYYPFTGVAPRVGRAENLSAVSPPAKPAKSYRRSWNNNWAYLHSQDVAPTSGGAVYTTGDVNASSSQDANGNQSDSQSGADHRKQDHSNGHWHDQSRGQKQDQSNDHRHDQAHNQWNDHWGDHSHEQNHNSMHAHGSRNTHMHRSQSRTKGKRS